MPKGDSEKQKKPHKPKPKPKTKTESTGSESSSSLSSQGGFQLVSREELSRLQTELRGAEVKDLEDKAEQLAEIAQELKIMQGSTGAQPVSTIDSAIQVPSSEQPRSQENRKAVSDKPKKSIPSIILSVISWPFKKIWAGITWLFSSAEERPTATTRSSSSQASHSSSSASSSSKGSKRGVKPTPDPLQATRSASLSSSYPHARSEAKSRGKGLQKTAEKGGTLSAHAGIYRDQVREFREKQEKEASSWWPFSR